MVKNSKDRIPAGMDKRYIENTTIESPDDLELGEYVDCTFKGLNLTNQDLSDYQFENCTFINCDLSKVKILETAFREVSFTNCQLNWIQFDTSKDFLFEICCEECQLDRVSFFSRTLKGMRFIRCTFKETDFSEADLTYATFEACDLMGATFDASRLENTDFRTAFNYVIDPEKNRVKGARFSKEGLAGLLTRFELRIE